ncbi:hypothetical protein [Bacillus safensis]|uniref:hypothetical protein n=1 Tax=Bacillus safensis TaxID=561879 RepID=UPI00201791E5|nr:hypothetical protein [Bacillus safensis]MCP8951679.1 hypothetical protein [Bacillus safensis]MCY7568336.1 hypothetical protein [Bacillus safensis]MEC3736930.1 hypothetical protein [Bacillus safensis]MED1458177.1 hypothetical protein [Bacillus safensis]
MNKTNRSKIFKLFIGLLTIIISTTFFSNVSSAEVKKSDDNNSENNQSLHSDQKDVKKTKVSMKDIKKIESYLYLSKKGTLILKPDYTDLNLDHTIIKEVKTWLKYSNQLVLEKKAVIQPDFSIKMLDESNTNSLDHKVSTLSKGCGKNGHNVYWWGYNLYFDCNETRSLYQSFKAGGGATSGIAAISRFIPVPPTQLASAIAGVIGGGLVGFGQMIQDEHEGHGVRIRFTGLGYAAVPSGVFPQ